MENDDFYFDLGYGNYKIVRSPYGTGIGLLIDRGIICEFHQQIFTAHTGNYYETEAILKYLENRKAVLQKTLINFVEGVLCRDDTRLDFSWDTKEAFGALFFTMFIKEVADELQAFGNN